MDEIIDRLAREAAEALATFTRPSDDSRTEVWLGGRCLAAYVGGERAREYAEAIRGILAPAFAAALRRFALTPPWPSPVSEERLAEILGTMMALDDAVEVDASVLLPQQVAAVRDAMEDSIAHANHLTRLVQAMSGESEGQTFGAGFEVGRREGRREGAKEQRAADLEAIRDGWPGKHYEHASYDEAKRALEIAPLVTDAP